MVIFLFDIKFINNEIHIKNVKNFDLKETLDCGQAFRWKPLDNGAWCGIAKGKYIELETLNGDIIIKGSSKEDFYEIWEDYFDLKRNYGEIIESISENEVLKAASEFGSGIRILNQDPWEALCSFIISQNNNIPRIKGIVERLCENFGEKCGEGYTFPSAETVSSLTLEDLSVLRSGFRAKYILDAANKVAKGEIDLEALKLMDFESAREILMTIKGVGPKVADCALLFGLGHIEAFPRDVWIKRALAELFDGELPPCAEKYAGIVQQYIFYYIRNREVNNMEFKL